MNNCRYHRQVLLSEIGTKGQAKLQKASILIVGVGGLGTPIALYLAGCGIGHLGLVDSDIVSTSNLHRQVLYNEKIIGQSKAISAANHLQLLNPEISITPYNCRLTNENAESIISQYDIVVDGCDNRETRILLDKYCQKLHKPYVYGSVEGFCGQVCVFHLNENSEKCYSNTFTSNNSEPFKGIVGPTAGIIGSLMATEVIKIVCNIPKILHNRLLTYNTLTHEQHVFDL